MKKQIMVVSILIFSSASPVLAANSTRLTGVSAAAPQVGENSDGGSALGRQCKYQKLIDEANAPLPVDARSTSSERAGSAS